MELWQPVLYSIGMIREWQIGPLSFSVERTQSEWKIALDRNEAQQDRLTCGLEESTIDLIDIKRWVASDNEYELYLEAALPDRPLIVRPDSPLIMLPGQKAMFFIGIPIWIRVKTRQDIKSTLIEIPSIILSNSWFGPPTDGELCYSMRTSAKLEIKELTSRPYRAVCPLEVRNAAQTPLEIQRICLRPEMLPIFQGKTHLWTASGRVTYLGENEWSRVVYGNNAPSFEADSGIVGEPRVKMARGFLAKTFQSILAFSDNI